MKYRGGDTPNSMAVERATEPSLRSYSPTSSIRASSELDYDISVPDSMPLDINSASDTAPRGPFVFTPSTPMSASVATLIPVDSPAETLMDSPRKEREDDLVASAAVSQPPAPEIPATTTAPTEENGSVTSSVIGASVQNGGAGAGVSSGSSTSAMGMGLLRKGKIDAKAQDDFIAYMLGKK